MPLAKNENTVAVNVFKCNRDFRNRRHFPAEIKAEYTAKLPGLMCKSLQRRAAFGGMEDTNETGTPAPSSTPSIHVLSEAFPSQGSRGLAHTVHSRSQQVTPGHAAPVPPARHRRDTSPRHQVIKPTMHQNSKTCSTKKLKNMLNPYPPLVPHLTWENQKAHFAHQKSSSMTSSLHWGPQSTLDAASVTVKLTR